MERRLAKDWGKIHLADNFTLSEFVISDKFPELAANIEPTWQQANNLFLLCRLVLQPVRDEFGRVEITSGLRDAALNEALRGEDNSQHLSGEAADFLIPGQGMMEVYGYCMQKLQWLGEMIYYQKRGHIHIALPNLFVKPDFMIKED